MPDMQRLSDKYAGVKLCDLAPAELEEFLGAIAKRGAFEALQATGLNDENAGSDVRDLRDLLKGFRVFRKAAWTTAVTGAGRVIGWAIVIMLLTLFMNSDRAQSILKVLK